MAMKALLPLALAAFCAIGALSAPSDEPQLPWDAPSWRPAPGMRVPYGVINIAISVIPRFLLRVEVLLGSKIPCKLKHILVDVCRLLYAHPWWELYIEGRPTCHHLCI